MPLTDLPGILCLLNQSMTVVALLAQKLAALQTDVAVEHGAIPVFGHRKSPGYTCCAQSLPAWPGNL